MQCEQEFDFCVLGGPPVGANAYSTYHLNIFTNSFIQFINAFLYPKKKKRHKGQRTFLVDYSKSLKSIMIELLVMFVL